MARIRTIKPEFWEDEAIGLLARDARLLFVSTWNQADDEGLLRWSAEFLKSAAFMYDADVTTAKVQRLMAQLEDAGMVFPYKGGKAQQRLAYIVNFRKHQKINRPQPGKLPPPSLQNREVIRMYAIRDHWTCHLCKRGIPDDVAAPAGDQPSPDHLVARINGGQDYPSNIKIAHVSCNKSRGSRPYVVTDSVTDSVNDSWSDAG